MWPIVRRINDLEPKLAGLSDASLQEKTFEFKNRLANGETLDDILPEAFAVVRDIAAFAVRVASPLPKPHEGGTIKRDEKGVFRAKTPGFIEFSFDAPQQVRSIHIVPSGNNVQAQRLRIEASTDGVTYQLVRQLTPPRQGWQNTDQNYTYSLPATTARYFRCYWTPVGTEPWMKLLWTRVSTFFSMIPSTVSTTSSEPIDISLS